MKSWIKCASATRLHCNPLWPSEIHALPSNRQRMDRFFFFLCFGDRASRYNLVKKKLHAPTCLWRWNRQSVPKRWHINFRCRGITQKNHTKNNLIHNLSLVYFVNLYMFWAYLGQSSGVTTVCIQHLVHIILYRWLSWMDPSRTKDSCNECQQRSFNCIMKI